MGGKPQPGAGVAANRVGDFQRADGSDQVTYRGYPVYYSSKDAQPGDRNGEGNSSFGGNWTAVPPSNDAPAR